MSLVGWRSGVHNWYTWQYPVLLMKVPSNKITLVRKKKIYRNEVTRQPIRIEIGEEANHASLPLYGIPTKNVMRSFYNYIIHDFVYFSFWLNLSTPSCMCLTGFSRASAFSLNIHGHGFLPNFSCGQEHRWSSSYCKITLRVHLAWIVEE